MPIGRNRKWERRPVEDINAITFRLESYLLQLSEINDRWAAWLARNEQTVLDLPAAEQLQSLNAQAAELMEELTAVTASRQQILDDAAQLGLPAADLHTLAKSLPAWKRPRLRGAISTAKRQLANLRRLHVATWVLISHKLQFYRDSMALMMLGTIRQDVYLQTRDTDTGGGQLLDASL